MYVLVTHTDTDFCVFSEILRFLYLWEESRKKKVKVLVALSYLTFCHTMDLAYQVPLSMEFSRQEYWSEQPFPSPGNLPDPGIKPRSPTLQILYCLSHQGNPFVGGRDKERRKEGILLDYLF